MHSFTNHNVIAAQTHDMMGDCHLCSFLSECYSNLYKGSHDHWHW